MSRGESGGVILHGVGGWFTRSSSAPRIPGMHLVVAERGSKAPGSKYLPHIPGGVRKKAEGLKVTILVLAQDLSKQRAVVWTKEKLYTSYIQLLKAVQMFINLVAPYVTPPTQIVLDKLQEFSNLLTVFVVTTFERFDDGLFSPVVLSVGETGVRGYEKTTEVLYCAKTKVRGHYTWGEQFVNSSIVRPATVCVQTGIVGNIGRWEKMFGKMIVGLGL